ncbi:MAG TPA: GGDEF domain-containing protein [Candidatus Acidoferrum sp.]|nr:GGDEF domain-containing protein [Candidatus Acidoferrum sp.]
MEQEFELDKEPLWAIPAPVKERLRQQPVKTDYDNFRLSAMYCTAAVFLLVVMGLASLYSGNNSHGVALLVFAAAATLGLAVLWLGHWYWMGKHFTTAMMVLLCLYLFYSGGVLNTGPLYYGVFPSVALFLQGRLRGIVWIIVLLVLTELLSYGFFGFEVSRYSNAFVVRVIVITMLITVLTCIPEYFRLKAERDLMLSINDLEALSYGDLATQLANRSFLEKMLQSEFNRNQRYGSHCCVMFVEPDTTAAIRGFIEDDDAATLQWTADVLRRNLRMQDVAGRWVRRRFLLILPEISLSGAKVLAERLLAEARTAKHGDGKAFIAPALCIGIAEMDRGPEQEVLRRAMNGLLSARKQGNSQSVAL